MYGRDKDKHTERERDRETHRETHRDKGTYEQGGEGQRPKKRRSENALHATVCISSS